ncbi:muscleblind-like protein 2a isoform X3 [Ornithodoros turicata]|uniref:muscleblind-like protein 2a isoform X3 n=1 Tax=Ornithodoros turicata TaxID=34597 RepID=UPI00313A10D9
MSTTSSLMAAAAAAANVKDSRWLQLEVCREFLRNKCSRQDTECKFAHPPPNVEVQNGRVIACYDSIKGRCNREKPPCKYFHPPQHLKDQLLINGRNHLALKNALLQQMPLQAVLPGQIPTAAVVSPYWYLGRQPYATGLLGTTGTATAVTAAKYPRQHSDVHGTSYGYLSERCGISRGYPNMVSTQMMSYDPSSGRPAGQDRDAIGTYWDIICSALNATTNPYMPALTTMATAPSFSPYLAPSPVLHGMAMTADGCAAPLSVVPASLVSPQKVARTDRIEVCREFQRGTCKRPETECRFGHPPDHVAVDQGDGAVTVCMDFVKGRCSRDQCRYFHPPPHLQAQLKATQNRAGAAAAAAMATEGGSADVGLQMYTQPAEESAQRGSTVWPCCFLCEPAFPGIVPYTKRPALDKSGVPVYQPSTTAYQQALALQMQQPFVPVSFTGHPAGVPRF